jgi:hypothetical protein
MCRFAAAVGAFTGRRLERIRGPFGMQARWRRAFAATADLRQRCHNTGESPLWGNAPRRPLDRVRMLSAPAPTGWDERQC